ncbi:hypothetical protein MVEN_00881800 [Mycena venus]|uniref:Uncharacterized protein n=1 Tax=Mycena venus TaxID=2733690 RepID=A0A8H6YC33_9AGAR|nr:hypothetical protein MVEN_00881800 [Mycena venus]
MARSLSRLPPSFWLEVAIYSELYERLALLRLTRAVNAALLHLLYRKVLVTESADVLVNTLVTKRFLLPLVISLCMEDPTARVDHEQWEAILPYMRNLETLVIAPSTIPMPFHIIPLIQFHLVSFHAITSIQGHWVDFLAACSDLEELALDGRFLGHVPSSMRMRRLSAIKAQPADIARFAERHTRLCDLWFFTLQPLAASHLLPEDIRRFSVSPSRVDSIRISAPDLLLLIAGAPALVSTLRCIVLDEDLTWSDFTLNAGPSLATNALVQLATALDSSFLHLKSVFLGPQSSTIAGPPASGPFIFFAMDGYVAVKHWGEIEEELVYIDVDDEWDEVCHRPAVILGEEDYAYLFP